MKMFGSGQKRLMSLLLTLVLLVSLVPVISLPAYAENLLGISVSNPRRYSSGCLQSFDFSYKADNGLALAYGKFAVHSNKSSLSYNNRYSTDGNSWPTADAIKSETKKDSTLIAFASNSADNYVWTSNTSGTNLTVTFEDGIIQPNTTYYLYLWTRSTTYGVYPEQLIGTLKIDGNGKLNFKGSSIGPAVHTHQWRSDPTGNGTKKASTTIFCADMACGEGVEVSLTASDVTLPGNVFSAQISVEKVERPAVAFALRPAPQAPAGLPEGLTVSDTPGYKYSPDGTNFTEIDPVSFTPKAGYYQASILVKDGNTTLENLYVNYTVSDPAVTAATGDNRPIALMIMGMAFFCAMAIAAFLLDGRRKAR